MEDKFLGVIPARGGSKRVPNKNMKLINGKPLLYWTIMSANSSKLLDKVIVSTDNEEISTFCKNNSLEVDKRNKELSGDYVSLTDVMKDIVERYSYDNVVILRPTSPIRHNNIIDKSIKLYSNTKADSLMTGFYNKEREWFTHKDQASQLYKGWFQGNGCVEITSSSILKKGLTYGDKRVKYVQGDIYNHEIDTEVDFIIVEALMKSIGL